MTTMMNSGFWESSPMSNLSDLDVAWSPNSSGSDQENQFSYLSSSQQLLSPASSTSTNTSSPPRRNRCPLKKVYQRNAANQRERKRMRTINEAFEGLRDRIPLAGGDRKLSKVDTLRLAIRYIHQLAEMVDSVESPLGYNAAKVKEEKAKVIIRCHGITGMEQQQQQYTYHQEDQHNTINYPLFGHSLSWEDINKPKYGPNNTLCAKIWTPQVETSIENSEYSSPYPEPDFPTL